MARKLIPWVVGLAERLEVRRNSETPGVLVKASSSRVVEPRSDGSSRTTEKAASPRKGGRRAALTTIGATAAEGGMGGTSGGTVTMSQGGLGIRKCLATEPKEVRYVLRAKPNPAFEEHKAIGSRIASLD
jgi:hypothetical protein